MDQLCNLEVLVMHISGTCNVFFFVMVNVFKMRHVEPPSCVTLFFTARACMLQKTMDTIATTRAKGFCGENFHHKSLFFRHKQAFVVNF